MIKRINILGVVYEIEEVEVVNKSEPRRGEINYLTGKIKLDKNMPLTLKEQVLTHEILHAVFDLLGLDKLKSADFFQLFFCVLIAVEVCGDGGRLVGHTQEFIGRNI